MLTSFEKNKQLREEAEEFVKLLEERPERFWEELIKAAREKLPKDHPMNSDIMLEDEALAFEGKVVPEWTFKGEKVRDVRPSYFVYLATEHPFVTQVKRYVKSRLFQRKLENGN